MPSAPVSEGSRSIGEARADATLRIERELRAYNEMQHRVAACLWELLEAETTEVWLWPFLSESFPNLWL
jgi:hypothetical protein